jgi:hypothetical protein
MKTNASLPTLLFCLAAVSAPAAGSAPAKEFTDFFDIDKAD